MGHGGFGRDNHELSAPFPSMCHVAVSLAAFVFLVARAASIAMAGEGTQQSHSESLYGKRLSHRKVDGVGPCIAADVVGDRCTRLAGAASIRSTTARLIRRSCWGN